MKTPGKHILLTGGAGYIGSHAAISLLQTGYEVSILDNFSNSARSVVNRIESITEKRVRVWEVDVTCATAMSQVISTSKPHAVMHFAGLKSISESIQYPEKYHDVNINGTRNILRAMREHGVNKVIFSSSAAVYGGKSGPPIVETSKLNPENPYAVSKAKCEQLIKDFADSHQKNAAIILRYFNPAGAYLHGSIRDAPKSSSTNLIPIIAQVAARRKKNVSVYGRNFRTPDKTGVRDYIHIADLVSGHINALEHLDHLSGADVFNLGTGQGYSVLEVIDAFQTATGKHIPYVFAPRRSGDLDSIIANPSKAKKVLGWEARFGLAEMCADAWLWQECSMQLGKHSPSSPSVITDRVM